MAQGAISAAHSAVWEPMELVLSGHVGLRCANPTYETISGTKDGVGRNKRSALRRMGTDGTSITGSRRITLR